jgi:hypothetical protein
MAGAHDDGALDVVGDQAPLSNENYSDAFSAVSTGIVSLVWDSI